MESKYRKCYLGRFFDRCARFLIFLGEVLFLSKELSAMEWLLISNLARINELHMREYYLDGTAIMHAVPILLLLVIRHCVVLIK